MPAAAVHWKISDGWKTWALVPNTTLQREYSSPAADVLTPATTEPSALTARASVNTVPPGRSPRVVKIAVAETSPADSARNADAIPASGSRIGPGRPPQAASHARGDGRKTQRSRDVPRRELVVARNSDSPVLGGRRLAHADGDDFRHSTPPCEQHDPQTERQRPVPLRERAFGREARLSSSGGAGPCARGR